jgi:hypothetical protein
MTATFVDAFRCEWLKRKRSFASAMVVGGSLFTPAIIIAARLIYRRGLPVLYAASSFWPAHWRSCWESMAIFFLPLGAILATSLVAQIELKSNAWKQVHTLPIRSITVFLSKLAVIVVMLAQFLALFVLGIYASAMLPPLLLRGVPSPAGAFAALPWLSETALYFVDCLPIVAAQYLMSLRSSNVLVPIGVGFMAWVGALAALSSKLALWLPYAYTIIHYVKDKPKGAAFAAHPELHWLAAGWFLALTIAGYALFVTQREKG